MKTLAHPPDKVAVLARLRHVRSDSVARWGRMTAPQMVCHLADAFRMAVGDMPVVAHASLLRRTVVKWIALSAPVPWPRGVIATVPEIDQTLGAGTKPGALASDVAQLEALTERFTRAALAGITPASDSSSRSAGLAGIPHPYFGRMSNEDWLRWGWLHLDHHLRQFGA